MIPSDKKSILFIFGTFLLFTRHIHGRIFQSRTGSDLDCTKNGETVVNMDYSMPRSLPETYNVHSSKSRSLNEWVIFSLQDVNIDTLPGNVNDVQDNLSNGKPVDLDYRLPITVIPNHYNIHLHPHIFTNNFTFNGTVQITTKAVSTSNRIVLHINEIEPHEISVTVNSKFVKTTHSFEPKYQFLNIEMAKSMKNESEVIITIKYIGNLNSALKGFYRSSYVNTYNETKWLAATHLEPVAARTMFPCFDEPALKATFQISVVRTADFTSISNTKLKSTIKLGEFFVDTFEPTPTMSTYLVALVVSDFDFRSTHPAYSAFARPNAINQTLYAASVMKPIVDYFENNLQQKYQLPKLDMIALPDFISGAMENWGLITYREANMLYHPKHSPITSKQSIASVIAHEISHQWFGNLVSPQWWKYTWLSEGFARYFQYHATAQVEPEWGMEDQFIVDQLQNSFGIDGLSTSHPMTHDVSSPTEISAIFDQISYGKGGSVLRMIEKVLGRDLFYAALHDYLAARQYNYGTPEDLFSALQSQVDKSMSVNFNVKEIMDSWTIQAGFPVVDVKINGNLLTLSQKRFLLRNLDKIDVDNNTWSIPITYTVKSKPDFSKTSPKSWLTTKTSSITLQNNEFLPDDWIIINIQQTGFYRVNYDSELWKRLINVLKSKHFGDIHHLNRAALMDDLLNLARAGDIDYSFALSATQYLSHESHYIPWRAALNGLNYLKKQLDGRDIYELFKVHILTILEPVYYRLGFDEMKNESHFDKLLRRNIVNWACEFGVDDCINNSLRLFADWRSNTSKLVPVNARMTVYCTAIKHGSLEDYNFLKDQYSTIDVAAERNVITSALGCSKNVTALETLLMTAIDTPSVFGSQDITNIFSSVRSAGLMGTQIALDFMTRHHNDISTCFGNRDKLLELASTLSTELTSQDLISQFQSYINTNFDSFPTDSKLLNSNVVRANEELTWYNVNGPKISEWLRATYQDSEYRLPTLIQPMTYNIFLTPNLEDGTFDGNVTIHMDVIADISSIVLHAHAMTIHSIQVLDGDASLNLTNHFGNSTTHKLTIQLSETVHTATKLTTKIKYSGVLNNNMVGFYRSYYNDDNGAKHWLASTQFQKFGARQAFPCFDEPSFKAKFTINIERPNDYHSLSNMPLRDHKPSSRANYTWDYYYESEIMSSYLVAFIISDFASLSINDNTRNFTVWSRPNAITSARNALDVAQKALSFLEKFTRIDYSIGKLDLAAIPDFAAGAMENWGLVTFREYGLLTSEDVTSATYMRYMATTVAHELVHMWFGNLVTCDWWDHVWLNEGFAEYLEYRVIDSINPDWDMEQHFVSYELQVALLKDSFPYIRPMNNKMETPFDDGTDFTSIAYQKSASVIHMMHRAFGEKIFTEALHTYLNQNKYKTSKPEYLWSAIQQHIDTSGSLFTNLSVATLMDSWASQPGYPVVHADYTNNHLRLTQERFLLTGRNETKNDQLYWVPITIASKSEPTFNASKIVWFGETSQDIHELNFDGGWFILNVQQSGYYRVNYGSDNWNKLIEALNENNFGGIPTINRAQIVDDILNLARAGYIQYSFALTAIQYLRQENHHLPWRAFLNAYAYLDERFDGHAISITLRRSVLELTKNIYANVSFEEAVADTQLMKTNRQLILSWICKLNYEHCVEKSKELFIQWRNDTNTLISADVKPAVICTALRLGDYSDWDFMWQKYLQSNYESDKIVILNALGCTENIEAVHRYLNTMFSRDGTIRDQNIATAFTSVYSAGKFGMNASLVFLMTNYTAVHDYYGDWDSVSRLFSSVASKLSTTAEIETLKRFIRELPEDLMEIEDSLHVTISSTERSLEFVTKHSTEIENWLEAFHPTAPSITAPGSSDVLSPSISIFSVIFNVLLITLY